MQKWERCGCPHVALRAAAAQPARIHSCRAEGCSIRQKKRPTVRSTASASENRPGRPAVCPIADRHAASAGLQGTLRGYDQATNLILDECHERVYSTKVGA